MDKKTKEICMYVLGGLIALGFFGTLIFLIWQGTYETTTNLLIGALIGAFTTIVSFFFGSSKSSQQKDDVIEKKLNGK